MFSEVLGVFLFLTGVVNAQIPCAKSWDGPSEHNDITNCDLENYIKDTYGIKFGIQFVFIFLSLFGYPILLIGRYCCGCCGSSKQRPGHLCCGGSEWDVRDEQEKNAAYGSYSVNMTKLSTIIAIIFATISVTLCLLGATRLKDAYAYTWTDTDKMIAWLTGIKEDLQQSLMREDGSYIEGFDSQVVADFENATEGFHNQKDSLKGKSVDYEKVIMDFSFALMGIPYVLFILSIIMAYAQIRKCGPLIIIILLWFFSVMFSTLGLTFSVVHAFVTEVGYAIDDQKNHRPGIFQWLVIPKCQAHADFENVKEMVSNIEKDNSINACKQVTEYCDNTLIVNKETNRIFYCNYFTTYKTKCANASMAGNEILNLTYGKSALLHKLCDDCDNNECTIERCSKHCVDLKLREKMLNSTILLGDAFRALDGYRIVEPLMDCNVLIDKTLFYYKQQSHYETALGLIQAGFCMYALSIWFLTFVLLLGQKRFVTFDGDKAFSVLQDSNQPLHGLEMISCSF